MPDCRKASIFFTGIRSLLRTCYWKRSLSGVTLTHRECCHWYLYLRSGCTLDLFSFSKSFPHSRNEVSITLKVITGGNQILEVIFSNSFSRGRNWSEIADAFGAGSVTELVIEGRLHWQDISRLLLHPLFLLLLKQNFIFISFQGRRSQINHIPLHKAQVPFSIFFFPFFFLFCQERRNTLFFVLPFSKQVFFQQSKWLMLTQP